MTYQLSRLRLANVGDRAARFTDITLDVSSSEASDPVDSILWLRNGGGKSSLLSLFFALLLPLRKDFMGRSVKRYLEDYVASGDTSHTAAEWVAQSEDSLLPPPRLITGAVYEWVDRRKPVDPDRDRDKLKGWYYSCFVVPGVLDLARLPVHDDTGRTRPMAEFVRALRDIAASRPQQFGFAITEQRGQWMESLTARNLDPALFRYQKQMNHSEGGVADLFNFPSTDKFIDFLIDLTVDSTQPDLVAANLRQVIEVLGRKPDLLVDRDFCAEMAGRLDQLAERHEHARTADREATEARFAASGLAGAFRGAALAQKADRDWFVEEAKRLRESALRLDRERKGVNDIANELFRVAARHQHAAAVARSENATSAAADAKNEDLAWEAVGHLAERVEAERNANSVRQQMAEEEQQTAPLRAARDGAAVALKDRYTTLADDERRAEEMEISAAEEAESNARSESIRAQENRNLATEAKVRAETVRGQVTEIGHEVDSAVTRGDLPDVDAAPAEVLAVARTAKREDEELLGTVRQRRAARPTIRRSLGEKQTTLATERAAKIAERDQLIVDREKLFLRVDALASDARLAELMQLDDGERLDLWTEAADLRVALTREAAAAESTIVDTRVDSAEDNRALDGLRSDDFLPTTRDAQRAADVLIAADVPAGSGWTTLRDLVTESERAVVLKNARVAELAAGVVVADADADKARAVVTSGEWHAVAHVTVCTATQMQQALTDAAPEHLVFPSEPSLFDRAAAENARTEREARREDQDRRIAALQEQATADRALLATVESLLRDCPAGHLDELHRLIDECDQAIEESKATDTALREQIRELDEQDAVDAEDEKSLTTHLTELAGRIARLDTLVEKVSELPELHRAIERFDGDVEAHNAIVDDAVGRGRAYQDAERTARGLAAERKANRLRYEKEDRAITLLDAENAAVVTDLGDPLYMLQSRFRDAESRWTTVAAQSVLAERLKGHTERVRRADRELADCPDPIRARAAELLGTGDGQDPDRRSAARLRSREVADSAVRELSDAQSALRQAEDEVKRRTPRDRPRFAQLDAEPATEVEARELAEVEAAWATEMSGEVTNLNRQAEEAEKAANEADTAVQVFTQRANRLADAAAPVDVPDTEPAYAGDDADADLDVVLDRLTSAARVAAEARRRADGAIHRVRQLASENRFVGIPDAIRDRFTGDDDEVLAQRAAIRAGELRVRRTTIEGQLADIGRDQRLVVVEVAALVRDVLANLESAHRHSKLPGTLGGWANEHFLRIRFVRPGSDEDLHVRIDAVVDRILAENSKPEGLVLLKRCVHEAVAPRGFTVKVLKPNSDLAVEPVDVTHLGKFSGGEKLTVCVALYCTLARLRAVNRGRGKAALGGTLVLDNPLGTASHVALLRLQRDVAAAHGVQLVYTTGVEDLGAVGQFPNVLRLRNAPGALRARRYVVLEERFGSAVEGITSVRVTQDVATNGSDS